MSSQGGEQDGGCLSFRLRSMALNFSLRSCLRVWVLAILLSGLVCPSLNDVGSMSEAEADWGQLQVPGWEWEGAGAKSPRCAIPLQLNGT